MLVPSDYTERMAVSENAIPVVSTVYYFNKIFSGNQPRQLVIGRTQRFGNHLRPHHQVSNVTGCLEGLWFRAGIYRRRSRHLVTQNPDDGDGDGSRNVGFFL
jgi:hypothetical protein